MRLRLRLLVDLCELFAGLGEHFRLFGLHILVVFGALPDVGVLVSEIAFQERLHFRDLLFGACDVVQVLPHFGCVDFAESAESFAELVCGGGNAQALRALRGVFVVAQIDARIERGGGVLAYLFAVD